MENQVIESAFALPDQRLRPFASFMQRGICCIFFDLIDHFIGVSEQALQICSNTHQRKRVSHGRSFESFFELRHWNSSGATGRLNDNPQRVAQRREQSSPNNRSIGDLQQCRAQCQQMGRQIPAVHCRNITRQWFQRQGVIPVIKMSSVPLHYIHGL